VHSVYFRDEGKAGVEGLVCLGPRVAESRADAFVSRFRQSKEVCVSRGEQFVAGARPPQQKVFAYV